MKKYHDTEAFRHVVKRIRFQYEGHLPTLTFRGTVKLHGTNIGIRRFKDSFHYQTRRQRFDCTCDHFGFAQHLDKVPRELLHQLFDTIGEKTDDITLFGEWIGPGIQKKVAIADLPEKQWVIFAAYKNGEYVHLPIETQLDTYKIFNVLNAGVNFITIDFNKPNDSVPMLERLTLQVEEECPYAKLFGISGIGEGIVWTCLEDPTNSDLWFKTKGQEHKRGNDKKGKIASVSPEVMQKRSEVIKLVANDDRLIQGLQYLTEINLDLVPENIGKYLKWVSQDILKEESDTLEANGVEWKDIAKGVNTKAKNLFFERMDDL